MLRKVLVAAAVLLLSANLWGVEVLFAPMELDGSGEGLLAKDGSDFSRQLIRKVEFFDLTDALRIRLGDSDGDIPVISILDAAAFSTFNGTHALIYGRLTFTENYIDAVLKLYDPESGVVSVTFYGRDSVNQEDRLLDDLASKVYEYLTAELGLAPIYVAREPETKLWDCRISLDYWTPTQPWRDALSGIASLGFTTYLTPLYPLSEEGAWLFGLRVGAGLLYSTGMNTPHSESFFFNGIRFGVPVEFTADYRELHRIGIGIQPFVMMDMIFQDRQYAGDWTGVTVTCGIAANVYYRYQLNDHSSLGVLLEVSTVFYDPVRVEIRPGLFYERRFGKKSDE